jgi:multicomponent Na+:H+ antiporter subunit F
LFRCRKNRARDQGWIRAQDRGGFQLMAGESFLDLAVQIAFALLSLSFLLTVLRVLKGPTLPDRILALDMLVAVGIGFIAVTGLASGVTFNVDIAIALGLVGFLATVAFARFVLVHSKKDDDPQLQIKKKT